MHNDIPETAAALQARTAELEQQLRLSDEGVSRLAQRCLELEQQVLTCKAELARHKHTEIEDPVVLLPQLFYDTGRGFSPQECLTAPETAYDESVHAVSTTFILPQDALAVRLDPGELPCCLTGLALSDERISFQPVNGSFLQENVLLFPKADPILFLSSKTGFPAGMKFSVSYHYYPLGNLLHEQPGKAMYQALDELKEKNRADAQEAAEVLQASQAACADLNRQLLELKAQLHEYETTLETMRVSSSWRMTAPLRSLLNLLRGR